jgi:hypothetical protein
VPQLQTVQEIQNMSQTEHHIDEYLIKKNEQRKVSKTNQQTNTSIFFFLQFFGKASLQYFFK